MPGCPLTWQTVLTHRDARVLVGGGVTWCLPAPVYRRESTLSLFAHAQLRLLGSMQCASAYQGCGVGTEPRRTPRTRAQRSGRLTVVLERCSFPRAGARVIAFSNGLRQPSQRGSTPGCGRSRTDQSGGPHEGDRTFQCQRHMSTNSRRRDASGFLGSAVRRQGRRSWVRVIISRPEWSDQDPMVPADAAVLLADRAMVIADHVEATPAFGYARGSGVQRGALTAVSAASDAPPAVVRVADASGRRGGRCVQIAPGSRDRLKLGWQPSPSSARSNRQ
jgi:hypothetical protein